MSSELLNTRKSSPGCLACLQITFTRAASAVSKFLAVIQQKISSHVCLSGSVQAELAVATSFDPRRSPLRSGLFREGLWFVCCLTGW